jgi:hypothetical protein
MLEKEMTWEEEKEMTWEEGEEKLKKIKELLKNIIKEEDLVEKLYWEIAETSFMLSDSIMSRTWTVFKKYGEALLNKINEKNLVTYLFPK